MQITKTKITASGKQYLRFAEPIWSEDGEQISNKVGFVEVLPEKADALLAKYLSGEKKRSFSANPNSLGNYDMLVVGAVTEPVHTVAAAE